MTWTLSNKDQYEIIAEIDAQTDRGAAVIAVAYLENRLTALIQSRLHDISKVSDRIFKGYGPLGEMRSKIDMGYVMGFYGPRTYKDLTTLRRIRNDFAHDERPLDFQSQSIKARCDNLYLPTKILRMGETAPPTEPRDKFMCAVQLLLAFLLSETSANQEPIPPGPQSPRFLVD